MDQGGAEAAGLTRAEAEETRRLAGRSQVRRKRPGYWAGAGDSEAI